jgi:hypothetical protein
MLNGIIDPRKVRAQKAVAASHSSGSTFIPHWSEYWLKIEMLKESLRQWDETKRQRNDFYALAFAQQ